MKNLVIAILVFSAFISEAYSLKCYKCESILGQEFTTEQCEEHQSEISCPDADNTCFKMNSKTNDGKEVVTRGCSTTMHCEGLVKFCNGTADDTKKSNTKECQATCCHKDFCNMGFTVSINMMLVMFAVLCSLKLF
ncbi:hypothetical protein OS493_016101 [Desmophyllum pertusum]|uniref:Activin types I and II receptor domain-containing protein n=1 Tax=Desmophyllum pertusum TaxID=174260 RepID=A0A9X0D910_9CNID|nr:hypothetical protein OS493_016101 [Desmophyllum pertusum]